MKCKIKVIKDIPDLFPHCRPEVGKVFDAVYYEYISSKGYLKTSAVIDFADKKILLRKNEFKIVEG